MNKMAMEDFFATGNQIKRLCAVLHSLGHDPNEWRKSRNIASFDKLTRQQCSDLITDLEAIEEQRKAKREQDIKTGLQEQISEQVPKDAELAFEEEPVNAEVARMGFVMQLCTSEAKKIADALCSNGGITEGTKAGMIQKLATTMFIEAMKRGL